MVLETSWGTHWKMMWTHEKFMRIWWKYVWKKNWASCSITMQQRKRKNEDEDYNAIVFGLVLKKNYNSFADPPLWTTVQPRGLACGWLPICSSPNPKPKFRNISLLGQYLTQVDWIAAKLKICQKNFKQKESYEKVEWRLAAFSELNHPIYPWTSSNQWTTKSIVQES